MADSRMPERFKLQEHRKTRDISTICATFCVVLNKDNKIVVVQWPIQAFSFAFTISTFEIYIYVVPDGSTSTQNVFNVDLIDLGIFRIFFVIVHDSIRTIANHHFDFFFIERHEGQHVISIIIAIEILAYAACFKHCMMHAQLFTCDFKHLSFIGFLCH